MVNLWRKVNYWKSIIFRKSNNIWNQRCINLWIQNVFLHIKKICITILHVIEDTIIWEYWHNERHIVISTWMPMLLLLLLFVQLLLSQSGHNQITSTCCTKKMIQTIASICCQWIIWYGFEENIQSSLES